VSGLAELLNAARGARVYDLGQPYYVGMPHHPVHPPFLYGLTKKHGDIVTPGGASSAAEAIALGGHVGTHIDGLSHFSCDGRLHGGVTAEDAQSYASGFTHNPIDRVAPIVRRGVLLDMAGQAGVAELAENFTITPDHLDAAARAHKVSVRAGDVVLLRTGWARFWGDAARYIRQVRGPGPELAGAQWLSARQVFAAGSDTIAFERVPAADMPVHVHLLVEKGIHILEALDLEQLAADGVYEFLFVAAPMKIRGGTGAPVRPLAFAS
jgi:kynurenine formamidase